MPLYIYHCSLKGIKNCWAKIKLSPFLSANWTFIFALFQIQTNVCSHCSDDWPMQAKSATTGSCHSFRRCCIFQQIMIKFLAFFSILMHKHPVHFEEAYNILFFFVFLTTSALRYKDFLAAIWKFAKCYYTFWPDRSKEVYYGIGLSNM